MKNKLLNFLKKYWFFVFLNIIMLTGTVLSKVFGDVYVQKNELYSFNLHSIYVFTVIPIYSLIYGCLSYVVCKKIWFQQILLALTLFLGFLITELISVEANGLIFGVLILIPCCTIFSILASAITKVIYKAISAMK